MAPQNNLVLVTGASGYIASYIIKQLQEEGWKVRGTVRDLTKEDLVKQLKELVPDAKFELELVEADLLKDESWKAAVQGCTHVVHVASPFPDRVPEKADDLIKPAVDGTLSVLKAVSEAGTVQRVVLTSSIASVYDCSIPIPKENEETKTFNEESWTDTENGSLDVYAKSKTLAEKAAWDFVKELAEDKKFDLVTVNPGMVIGPLLNNRYTTSHQIIKRLLDKSTPAVVKLNLNIVDVRDVAQAHVKALTQDDVVGKRHLVVSHNCWLKDVAIILQKEFKPKGYFVPTISSPNLLARVASIYDKGVKIVLPRLGKEAKYDNKRMQDILKITPTDLDKTILDTAYSFMEMGIIKKSKKEKKPKEEGDKGTAEEVAKDGEKSEETSPKELEPEDKDKVPSPAVDAVAPVEVSAN